MDVILEKNRDVLDKFRELGFEIHSLGTITDNYSSYVYQELSKSFSSYHRKLMDEEEELSLKPQLKIDYLISLAIDIKEREHNGETISDNDKFIFNAVKKVLIEEMTRGSSLLMGTIIFEDNNYGKLLFDDLESMNMYKEYVSSINNRVDKIMENLKNNNYKMNELLYHEKLLLFKALESGLYDEKYKDAIKHIDKYLLNKLEYGDEDLLRVENEYILRKVSKDKCRRNNIMYRKVYYSGFYYGDTKNDPTEMCNSEHYMDRILGRLDRNLITVSMYAKKYRRIPILLHESEHLVQRTKNEKLILNMSSLSDVFCDLLRKMLSKDKYDEYKENYKIKTNEIFANEAAIREYNELLKEHDILPNERIKDALIRVDEKKLYSEALAKRHAKDIENNEYTIHMYNVIMTGKILEKFSELIEEYPLLNHFFNKEEKRLKSLIELSNDYKEQDVNGRNTFFAFVEYQVINGDLDNVDLSKMSRVDRVCFFLMLTRSITNLISRFSIAILNGIEERGTIEKEMFAILSKELDFIKNNSNYINEIHELINSSGNYIEGLVTDKQTTLTEEEKEILERQMTYEHTSFDIDMETKLQLENRTKLKSNISEYQSNPLYLLDLYSKYSLEELMYFATDTKQIEEHSDYGIDNKKPISA